MSKIFYCSDKSLKKNDKFYVNDSYEKEVIYSKEINNYLFKVEEIDEKYVLTERIFNSLKNHFNYSTNIYALLEKDNCFISKRKHRCLIKKPIKIENSIHLDNVYDELLKLQSINRLDIINYNNHVDNSDLISNTVDFDELLLFHPELLFDVNNYIRFNNLGDEYTDSKLLKLFEQYLKKYSKIKINNNYYKDKYLEIIYIQFCNYFMKNPDLLALIQIDYNASNYSDRTRKRLIYRVNYKTKNEE